MAINKRKVQEIKAYLNPLQIHRMPMRKAEVLYAAETYKMYRTATQKDPGV